MKKEEIIIRIWRMGILVFLSVAGTLVLIGNIANPFTHDQIAGIVVLMFALIHTEYIGKALERKGQK